MSFKIVVVAGPQGCGKSTFIKKNKRKNDVVLTELSYRSVRSEIADLKVVRKIMRAANIGKVAKGRTVWLETQDNDKVFLDRYSKNADFLFVGVKQVGFQFASFEQY